MVWTGPPGAQRLDPGGAAMIPPPTALRPELTDDDVRWLNDQMALVDRPPVRYARELPLPPPPSGRRRSSPPAVDVSWVTTAEIPGAG